MLLLRAAAPTGMSAALVSSPKVVGAPAKTYLPNNGCWEVCLVCLPSLPATAPPCAAPAPPPPWAKPPPFAGTVTTSGRRVPAFLGLLVSSPPPGKEKSPRQSVLAPAEMVLSLRQLPDINKTRGVGRLFMTFLPRDRRPRKCGSVKSTAVGPSFQSLIPINPYIYILEGEGISVMLKIFSLLRWAQGPVYNTGELILSPQLRLWYIKFEKSIIQSRLPPTFLKTKSTDF